MRSLGPEKSKKEKRKELKNLSRQQLDEIHHEMVASRVVGWPSLSSFTHT
jgi:hypothetical protein